MKYDYQVIIVGAGPAGAMCAYKLASMNMSVLIIEKEKLPRNKPCGGALSIKAKEIIDFDISNVVTNKINSVVFTYNEEKLTYEREKPFTSLVDRSQFDYYLVNKACERGADLLEGHKVKTIKELVNGVKVVTSEKELFSQTLVGADGVLSTVAREVGLNQNQEKSITFEGDLSISSDIIEKKFKDIFIDLNVIPFGYGWIFPRKRQISVGIGQVIKSKTDYKESFKKYLTENKLENSFFSKRPRGYLVPKGGKISKIFSDNVLLVGDAAGLADPLTGEGIYYALKSGIYAAELLEKKINNKITNLSSYQKVIEKEIESEFKIARKISYIFYKFNSIIFNLMKKDEMFVESIVNIISGELGYKDLFMNLNKFSLLKKLS